MDAFWVAIDANGQPTLDWAQMSAETEVGSDRICYDCDWTSRKDVADLQLRILELEKQVAKGGPISAEYMKLDDLLAEMEKWKAVASGQTCVSFVRICYGASSLWHQSHMKNFRKIDRKPRALSEWVLEHAGTLATKFPDQVLEILKKLSEENERLKGDGVGELLAAIDYAFNVFEGHCRSNAHSLGCDIVMLWMKQVLGKPLEMSEILELQRHLPPKYQPVLKETASDACQNNQTA